MPAPGELTYYDRIGPAGREHALNKPFSDDRRGALTMEAGAIFLLLPPPPCRVLECGCGAGWLSWLLAKSGYEVTGQDVNEDAIRMARANPMFRDVPRQPEFLAGDYENMTFTDAFDAVVFFDAFHHALDMNATLQRACQSLKPNGIMIASEPGAGHAKQSGKFMREWGVTDRDAPPSTVVALGKKAGFSRAHIYPHAGLLGSSLYRRGSPVGRILRILHHVFAARRNGIVVLVK